jgi:hypothetical protein
MKRKSYHLNVEVLRAQHFSQALHYVLMDVTTSNRSQHPPYCVCVCVCVVVIGSPPLLLSSLYSLLSKKRKLRVYVSRTSHIHHPLIFLLLI